MFGSSSGGTGLFGAQNKLSSFLFGSSNNSGAPSGGFSLGNTNNNTNTANNTSSFGGFGSKPAATGFGSTAPSSGGLFGSTASNTGGLFGSNSGNTAGSTNTASGTSSGLFGGNNAGTGTSGGLFGNSGNASSTLGKPASTFGSGIGGSSAAGTQPGSSGGLFGGNNNNASSGGLFGSNNNNNNSTGTASGGLFGASSTNQTGQTGLGGLFGGSQNSGGLFGGSNTQNAQSSTGFGNNLTLAGGLFGGQKPQTGAQSGGLFGQANQSGGAQTGGLFGQANQTSGAGGLFGKPAAAPAQNNIAQPQANSAQPSFSWSANQAQPQPTNTLKGLDLKVATAAKTQPGTSTYTPAVNDQLTKLKEQWDPNLGKCAFKTHLYNKFSEAEIAVLMQQPRPANESPEDWEKAMAERPSPLHYPVRVTSFSEVAQRIEVQLDHVAKSRILLNNIYEKLNQLSSQREIDTTTRILRAKEKHTKLLRRLLKLATTLAVLKLQGYPLLPEEEEMLKQFQALNARLSDPNGAVGKLSDLYARLAILKGRSEELSSHLESSISTMNGGLNKLTLEGDTQNEQLILLLTKLLYKQQAGLSYLNEVVQLDLSAVSKR